MLLKSACATVFKAISTIDESELAAEVLFYNNDDRDFSGIGKRIAGQT
jgi:hypothetical protein